MLLFFLFIQSSLALFGDANFQEVEYTDSACTVQADSGSLISFSGNIGTCQTYNSISFTGGCSGDDMELTVYSTGDCTGAVSSTMPLTEGCIQSPDGTEYWDVADIEGCPLGEAWLTKTVWSGADCTGTSTVILDNVRIEEENMNPVTGTDGNQYCVGFGQTFEYNADSVVDGWLPYQFRTEYSAGCDSGGSHSNVHIGFGTCNHFSHWDMTAEETVEEWATFSWTGYNELESGQTLSDFYLTSQDFTDSDCMTTADPAKSYPGVTAGCPTTSSGYQIECASTGTDGGVQAYWLRTFSDPGTCAVVDDEWLVTDGMLCLSDGGGSSFRSELTFLHSFDEADWCSDVQGVYIGTQETDASYCSSTTEFGDEYGAYDTLDSTDFVYMTLTCTSTTAATVTYYDTTGSGGCASAATETVTIVADGVDCNRAEGLRIGKVDCNFHSGYFKQENCPNVVVTRTTFANDDCTGATSVETMGFYVGSNCNSVDSSGYMFTDGLQGVTAPTFDSVNAECREEDDDEFIFFSFYETGSCAAEDIYDYIPYRANQECTDGVTHSWTFYATSDSTCAEWAGVSTSGGSGSGSDEDEDEGFVIAALDQGVVIGCSSDNECCVVHCAEDMLTWTVTEYAAGSETACSGEPLLENCWAADTATCAYQFHSVAGSCTSTGANSAVWNYHECTDTDETIMHTEGYTNDACTETHSSSPDLQVDRWPFNMCTDVSDQYYIFSCTAGSAIGDSFTLTEYSDSACTTEVRSEVVQYDTSCTHMWTDSNDGMDMYYNMRWDVTEICPEVIDTSSATCDDLEGEGSDDEEEEFPVVIVAGGAGGGIVALVTLACLIYCCCCRKKQEASVQKIDQNAQIEIQKGQPQVMYVQQPNSGVTL